MKDAGESFDISEKPPLIPTLFPNHSRPMAVPKRRTAKMKKRLRRSGQRWRAATFKSCPECGSSVPSHIACPSCGYYKDRQVLSVETF